MVGKKIKAVRLALKLSQESFGGPVGLTKSHLSGVESGSKNISQKALKSLKAHYHISATWWETGEGEMFEQSKEPVRPPGAFDIPPPLGRIPIISWAQAGTDGFFIDSYPVGSGFAEINRPYDVSDPNAYALIVSGDSMSPRYEPGDILLVSPNTGVRTGTDAVVRLRDGEVMVKRVKNTDSHYILESFNPDYPPIECRKEDVLFVHRIVWVKRGE